MADLICKTVRMFPEEAAVLKRLADLDGRGESNFIRFLIRRAAKDRGIVLGEGQQ